MFQVSSELGLGLELTTQTIGINLHQRMERTEYIMHIEWNTAITLLEDLLYIALVD